MNPEPGELYNQIADDRDHAGMRLPNECRVDYGYGPGKLWPYDPWHGGVGACCGRMLL